MVSRDSTPSLSAASSTSNHDDIHHPSTPTKEHKLEANDSNKPDTPLPKHKKKKKISSNNKNKYLRKSSESMNMEFAVNQIDINMNQTHFAESEDDLDPLD